ncbi:MAG: hypothetical protein OZ914_07720 [Anaerolineaceae bacterium]|nr:hypothetical protein [Anaerolineaceae bacterium]
MNDKRMKGALENIARRGVPEDVNLMPYIAARLERKTLMTTLRARPILMTLTILLALTLLTGAVYAIGKLTGFIPGVGFVETSTLRVLAEPVAVTHDGITVSVEQVVADSERTIIVYKTEGLTVEAANSKGEGGGPFGSESLLRLSDGTALKEISSAGYVGTPEPLTNQVTTEGGWPNYVWRLVYPSAPLDANELTLVIPVLQNMPVGAAPENWEITFRLKPAPPEMTFAPVTVLPTVNASATETGGTTPPIPSNVTTLHGFTFQLDSVIELEDGFVFTGNLSWDNSAFPSGKGMVTEPLMPILTDADGQRIPIEEVRLDAPYDEFHAPWSYRTNRKAFSGPLTLSVPSIKTNIVAQPVDFEIDFGPNPQVGQSAEVNRDFMVEGRAIRLLSVSLIPAPDSCQGMMVDFKFSTDAPNISADVKDSVPSEPMVCSGGGGGGGGAADLTVFNVQTTYKDIPTGVRRFSFEFWIPYEVIGPWQVQWNPPLSSEPIPTPQAGACLTLEKWNQLTSQDDALLSGVDGKIVVTINEGGMLPAIYVGNPNGTDLQKIAIGAWPSLSNDGTQLVYSAQDGLHVVNLSSGQSSTLGVDGYRIIWSPDDTRWMFTNTFNIYVVNADGSGLQKMNIPSGQVLAPVGLLPDNQTIVYSALSGDGFNLKTYNLQSGETKDLFTIHNKAGYGAISPDGQWIVFADRQFGETNWGIYISRLDGSERKLVAEPQVPTAFASVWSPDSQWLMINTLDATDRAINGRDRNRAILVNPFTCETYSPNQVDGIVEGWSR